MRRCRLGCGLVVWDIDEHLVSMHPERVAEYPPENFNPEPGTDYWTTFYRTKGAREQFERDWFSPIVL